MVMWLEILFQCPDTPSSTSTSYVRSQNNFATWSTWLPVEFTILARLNQSTISAALHPAWIKLKHLEITNNIISYHMGSIFNETIHLLGAIVPTTVIVCGLWDGFPLFWVEIWRLWFRLLITFTAFLLLDLDAFELLAELLPNPSTFLFRLFAR